MDQFNLLKPHLNKWGSQVDSILINEILLDLVKSYVIKILPQYRLKEDRSLVFKALYRKKNYLNPIRCIEDKIGTRIVVLKSDDISTIQERILKCEYWHSKVTKSINQEIEDKPNIFDYQSVHIVVSPLSTNESFSNIEIQDLTCEIQIRTLLQHAFAEVSHDSTYKGPYKNDKEILRRLAKAMALMEATDDYFCNIFNLMTDEKRFYAQYLNGLINVFKYFNPHFSSDELNYTIVDNVFELLRWQNVDLQDIEVFVEKFKVDLNRTVKASNGLLFQQPVIILVLYYFYNHRTFLRDNWPLSIEVLKNVYKMTGTSYDDY